jgi:hypothetical protein
MSYPRNIQTLVIEDETDSKEYFEAVFASLKSTHILSPPHWAFCLEDAKQSLGDGRIYHLVTIDLRLPEKPGQPPSESVDFGLSLIKDCANRNSYPIPAVLVISGHLGQTSQQQLDDLVRNSFAYGRVLVKSDHLKDEIELALQFVERYCDLGIHVRDSGTKTFPTLTPREEYLLRQAILGDDQRIGLDLAWWSAAYDPYDKWTKTLMGRFLLGEGRGHSLHTFFKLAACDGARNVFRDAEMLNQKLKHIKVVSAHTSGDRSLLVTQSAGSGNGPPLSLDDVLSRPAISIGDQLPRLAKEVATQVAALGDRTPDQRELRQLLWKYHDADRIANQWQKRGGEQVLEEYGAVVTCPVELFKSLAADGATVRYDLQSALHGDLNYSNIAIDEEDGVTHGFIFDASGSQSGVCVRDIAMLEVTVLLHQQAEAGVLRACAPLYATEKEMQVQSIEATDREKNTFTFIRGIREVAEQFSEPHIYALMVVDNALLQLGGLDFGSSYNKIVSPHDACLLAGLTSRWYQSIRPKSLG